MADPRFYTRLDPLPLADLADRLGGRLGGRLGAESDPAVLVSDVAALSEAGPGELTFCDAKKHKEALAQTGAGACLLTPAMQELAPAGLAVILVDNPAAAFAEAADIFYPPERQDIWSAGNDLVDPSAQIDRSAVIAPGAVIGPGAEIGAGTQIGPNSVIGGGVAIGRNCRIGPHVTITHAFLGDRVVVHSASTIGQDGFGYVPGPKGHRKIPQLGRVIVQDDVEIGALSAIDRGALQDTIIGQGTKIDNLVQIGHNCRIGRHCVLAGQVGLSGSTVLGDFVVLGGQVGSAGHMEIGTGAQVAAQSGLTQDVPAGAIYGGSPARPIMRWKREHAVVRRMAESRTRKDGS